MILMLRLTLGWALIGVGTVILPTPVPIGLMHGDRGAGAGRAEASGLAGWLRRRRLGEPRPFPPAGGVAPSCPALGPPGSYDLTLPYEAPLATGERSGGSGPLSEPPSRATVWASRFHRLHEGQASRAGAAAGDIDRAEESR